MTEYDCNKCLNNFNSDKKECPECGSEDLNEVSRNLDSKEDSLQV